MAKIPNRSVWKTGTKKHSPWVNINIFARAVIIIFICSTIISLPMTQLTLSWSKSVSYRIYGNITRILHVHSPTIVTLDGQGVPIINLGYQRGTNIGVQRNPLTIATKAITYYSDYLSNQREKEKTYFMNCIDWLDENYIAKETYHLWAYDFEQPSYNASAPWYSAMAQARIMVAFEKAYELTGDEHYSYQAKMALASLSVKIDDGGVLRIDPVDGGYWYEEVAGGGSPPSYILNGFIFCLIDLDEYYSLTNAADAKSAFRMGVIELKRHLPDYDTGKWTYYDRQGHLAYDYHYVHIEQMRELYKITADEEFKTYHDKWASYFPWNPLWARERFAAYLFMTFLVFVVISVSYISYKLVKKKRQNWN
jgi:hypothetical protein